jgi:hypothetical protein
MLNGDKPQVSLEVGVSQKQDVIFAVTRLRRGIADSIEARTFGAVGDKSREYVLGL